MPPAKRSPLAPATAPVLPPIAGARLAALACGIRFDYELVRADDGVRLYETPHLCAVGLMAHRVRTQRHGRKVFRFESRITGERLTPSGVVGTVQGRELDTAEFRPLPKQPAGAPAAVASTTWATPSSAGAPGSPSSRLPAWRRAVPTPCARRSVRPTT